MSESRIRTTSVERARNAYRAAVRKLVAGDHGFSSQDMRRQDHIWEGWCRERELLMGTENRESPETLSEESARFPLLLENPEVQESFKERILAILLVPRLGWAPFHFRSNFPTKSFVKEWLAYRGLSVKVLSPKLQAFVASLLELNLDTFGWDRGHSYFDENTRHLYNQLILQVLEALPPESPPAVRLFGRYQMVYKSDPASMERLSGDPFFCELLNAPIPVHWKKRADIKRRVHIKQHEPRGEKAHDAATLKEWSDMVQWYAYDVQRFLDGDPAKDVGNVEVFLRQIAWIVRLAGRRQLPPIWRYDSFTDVLCWLQSQEHADLRRRFVRHMLFSQDDGASVLMTKKPVRLHGVRGCRLARYLINEVEESDQELAQRLRQMVSDYEARSAASDQKLAGIRAAEQNMC